MSLLRSASVVSALTLASRVTGLVREQLIAAAFGASSATDAFQVAFRIPNLLRRLFAEGAFSQAFVPILAASRTTHGDAATQTLIDAVATVLMWALVVVCAVGVLGSPVLVWVMPPPVLFWPPFPLTSARLKRSMTALSMARTTVWAVPPR